MSSREGHREEGLKFKSGTGESCSSFKAGMATSKDVIKMGSTIVVRAVSVL